jgi:hypothetical protein
MKSAYSATQGFDWVIVSHVVCMNSNIQDLSSKQASKRDRDRKDKPRGIGMENSEP